MNSAAIVFIQKMTVESLQFYVDKTDKSNLFDLNGKESNPTQII